MVASGSAGSLSQLLSFLKHAASDPLNSEPQVRMRNHESSSSDRRGEQQHEKKLHNVKAITQDYSQEVNCWKLEGIVALQEEAEDFLVHLFKGGMLCAAHAKRVTLSEVISTPVAVYPEPDLLWSYAACSTCLSLLACHYSKTR